MSDVILVTHWTGGDVIPFIHMGKILKKNGHNVSILTHCVYEEQVKEVGLDFYPVDTAEEYQDLYDKMYLLLDPFENLSEYISFFRKFHGEKRILREYEIIRNIKVNEDAVVIARHRSSISGLFAAEKLGYKSVSVFLAPNYLSHINVHEELFGAETLEEYNSARNSIGLKSIDSLKDYYFFPTKLFGVWPEWFAPKEADWPENLALLGFINKETAAEDDFPEEIEELLASDKKKVLITGGTSKFVRKEFYELAQSGVAETDCCGIMVIPFESQLPENTPDNIVLVREACVSRLMFHVDAVIHHGGMGTSSEAIVAGVPQIILSHIIDGRDNAFRLQELGAAVNIPVSRWKQEYIQKALEYIFSGKMAESCMDVRQKYNDDHFDRNLIREAERVMRGDTDLNNDIRHEKADGAVNRKNVMDEKIRKAILRSISKRR